MSKFQFLRSYLLIVVSILAVGWSLDRILLESNDQPQAQIESLNLKSIFLYLESKLLNSEGQLNPDWQSTLSTMPNEFLVKADLLHENDFFTDDKNLLTLAAKTLLELKDDQNNSIYYKRIKQTRYYLSIKPLWSQQKQFLTDDWLIYCYYLLVASALLLWLWPIYRDLQTMRQAAIEFGSENFSARVKLGKHSNLKNVADAFNIMAQKIQELIISHEALTHAVSHELKTPLARLQFSQEMLKQTLPASQHSKYIQTITQDIKELDELIDEMLSYAKFSADNLNLHLQNIPLDHWLKQLIQDYASEPITIDLTIQANAKSKQTRLDSRLMSRAMHNIIRNGLRYAKSRIIITLSLQKNQFSIVIEDDGAGIPENLMQQIFEPFARLDHSRSKHSGGYGLGLAIAKKIIEQHQGSILATRSKLGGAQFEINLPNSKNVVNR